MTWNEPVNLSEKGRTEAAFTTQVRRERRPKGQSLATSLIPHSILPFAMRPIDIQVFNCSVLYHILVIFAMPRLMNKLQKELEPFASQWPHASAKRQWD